MRQTDRAAGMPGNDHEAEGAGLAGARQQQQPLKLEKTERGRSHPPQDGRGPSPNPTLFTNSQEASPFHPGPLSPFVRASQLQALLLQQCAGKEVSKQLLQLMTISLEEGQDRPTVLRRGTQQTPQHGDSTPKCKALANESLREASSQQAGGSPQHTSPSPKPKSSPSGPADPKKSAGFAQSRSLYVNGLCRWPGCEEVFEEYPHFLKHLYRDHSIGERSLAQFRVQQDMVHHMENQLALERQKLLAMQFHLSVSTRPITTSAKEGPEGPLSLQMDVSQSQVTDGAPYCASNDTAEVLQQAYWHMPASHLLPEIVPSIECYKYTNVRPPFTYASLIRWAILESPDKQLSLNQIYHWFTKMFLYFRYNTTTWKNAVRHNLSLHRCFVRVERGKGAVWTVDETEFQKRKGQKFNRDHGLGCFSPYTFCPPQPSPRGANGDLLSRA